MKAKQNNPIIAVVLTHEATNEEEKALNSTTQFAAVEGRTLAYRIFGKGSPIIFINRFRGTLDTWDPLFLEKMAEKNQIILFDYTGIGSSTGELPTDLTHVAKDIKDLADYLKLEKIAILGWSYGGTIAQVATILYPQLITQAVLLGTGPPGKNEAPLEQAFLDAALKPINSFEDEIILFFEPDSPISVAAAKASHDRIAKHLDVPKIPSTMEVFDRYFQGGAGYREDKQNFREQLKSVTIPLLIMCGDHDISFPVENWYPFTRQLQNAQIITFLKSGHAPQHQYPELAAQYIIHFLALSK